MPKISIIVPVYNLAPYIERCIKSIQASREQDYEIIIIDDGSTDESSVICDTLARLDSRIRLYRKTNGGVGTARNLGIEMAKGEWVSFIDGDDEISPDFLTIPETLNNCDVIQKGLIYRKTVENMDDLCYSYDQVIEGQDDVFRYFIQFGNLELANKLIKCRNIGQDRFSTNISIGEDGLFFFTILNKVRRWGFSTVGEYIYIIRLSSAMNSTIKERRINIWFNLIETAYKIAVSKNCLVLYENYIADKYIPAIWYEWDNLTTKQKIEFKNIINSIDIKNLFLLSRKHFVKYLLILIQYLFKRI